MLKNLWKLVSSFSFIWIMYLPKMKKIDHESAKLFNFEKWIFVNSRTKIKFFKIGTCACPRIARAKKKSARLILYGATLTRLDRVSSARSCFARAKSILKKFYKTPLTRTRIIFINNSAIRWAIFFIFRQIVEFEVYYSYPQFKKIL